MSGSTALHERAEAIRFYLLGPVIPRHQEIYRQYCAKGLESDGECYRRASVDLVDEFGERLIDAIRILVDGRVRTREGAIKALCRDWRGSRS